MEYPNLRELLDNRCKTQEFQRPVATAEQKALWDLTRAKQQVDERGIPVEGWLAHIEAMKADGRLVEVEEGKWCQPLE
jgi:hypothetical protein